MQILTSRELDDLREDVLALARATLGAPHVDRLLQNGLDWIERVAPYDLACIFELRGSVLQVRAARGRLVSERVMKHAIRLDDFPSIQQALESGLGRAFTADDHTLGDGDPFDGVLDLPPGHSCMVVPLCAAGSRVGILTLDRTRCEPYPEQTVRLIEVCCQLMGLAVENAQQRERLERFQLQQSSYLESLQLELLPQGVVNTYRLSSHPRVRSLLERIPHIAPLAAPVLVEGETGVGKEVFARLLHEASPRRKQPFIKVNCASLPESLFESELFGHVKGAFTGATADRLGRFRTANGGTLFLDEIGEAPLSMQAKLLRVLQEGEFEPVGSDRTMRVDVRIIAATNVELKRAIEEKRFRADLYYRLSVFPVTLPPLRERTGDLPLLCEALLVEAHTRNGRGPLKISEDGLELLRRYPWPGNVRELGNVLERASYLRGPTAMLTRMHLEPALGPALAEAGVGSFAPAPGAFARLAPVETASEAASRGRLDELQRAEIIRVLGETRGKLYGNDGAASRLGLKPSTLQARMKKLGIDRLEAAVGASGQ